MGEDIVKRLGTFSTALDFETTRYLIADALDEIERLRVHMDVLLQHNIELLSEVASLRAAENGKFSSTSTTEWSQAEPAGDGYVFEEYQPERACCHAQTSACCSTCCEHCQTAGEVAHMRKEQARWRRTAEKLALELGKVEYAEASYEDVVTSEDDDALLATTDRSDHE